MTGSFWLPAPEDCREILVLCGIILSTSLKIPANFWSRKPDITSIFICLAPSWMILSGFSGFGVTILLECRMTPILDVWLGRWHKPWVRGSLGESNYSKPRNKSIPNQILMVWFKILSGEFSFHSLTKLRERILQLNQFCIHGTIKLPKKFFAPIMR